MHRPISVRIQPDSDSDPSTSLVDRLTYGVPKYCVNTLPTLYRLTQWVERSITEPFYQDDCGRRIDVPDSEGNEPRFDTGLWEIAVGSCR